MSNVIVSVLLTVCMTFGVALRYAPFDSLTGAREKRRIYICYFTVTAVNLVLLMTAMFIWGGMAAFTYLRYGGIVYASVITLVNILLIKGRTREHLFVSGVVITCNYLLMTVPNYAVTFLPKLSVTVYLFIVIGIYMGLLMITHLPLRRLLCGTVKPFLQLGNSEYWNTIWFIPIAFFGTKFVALGGDHNTGSIGQLISSMLYASVIILMCMSITASQERQREKCIMERQLEGQKIHYNELKVRVDDARKTKHDFKHHLTAIRHYVDIDDKAGLRNYCDELLDSAEGRGSIPYTGNAAADGLLYHYIQRASDEKIDFRYSGTIHSSGIADTDLCVLFGNALDNAFAGCLTLASGRKISVMSQSEKKLITVVIRNTFDGKVEQTEEGILSRKRDNSHGVGLSSMKAVCERYGGSMDVQWDDNNFTVMFILPVNND